MYSSQAADEAAKILVQMKVLLYGTDTQEPQTELAAQLAQEFYNHDMLLLLVQSLHRLDFEVSEKRGREGRGERKRERGREGRREGGEGE